MTAKEYLKQIRRQKLLIDVAKADLQDIRQDMYCVSGVAINEKVQSCPRNDVFLTLYVKVCEQEETLSTLILKYLDMKEKITQEIAALEDDRYVEILFARYFDGLSFKDIAKKVCYDYRWTRTLHKSALLEFERVYQDKLKDL